MWVFVSKLDNTTTRKQLSRFIAKGLRPGWAPFPCPTRGEIRRCEILHIIDRDRDTIEFHGLAQIEPVKSALSAISRLHGSKFGGRQVEVRKFQRRASPDRRDHLHDWGSASGEERRQRERRRSNILTGTHASGGIQGLEVFQRLQN